MPRTDVTLSVCGLVVRNVAEAVGFYHGKLGFEVYTDVTFEGHLRVSVGPPAQPGLRILLQPPDARPGASRADRRVMDDLTSRGLLGRLVFETADCDAIFEQLEAAGAEVVQKPVDQPHGTRDCVFSDPSGNLLTFSQPRRAHGRGLVTGRCAI
jgi:catechol 2,3-dioxygenase-like lactoylglutathione lyase family enzyme